MMVNELMNMKTQEPQAGISRYLVGLAPPRPDWSNRKPLGTSSPLVVPKVRVFFQGQLQFRHLMWDTETNTHFSSSNVSHMN